jgi:hypothetical protein
MRDNQHPYSPERDRNEGRQRGFSKLGRAARTVRPDECERNVYGAQRDDEPAQPQESQKAFERYM